MSSFETAGFSPLVNASWSFDNLMRCDVVSASGAKNTNDASDVLGKILRESRGSFKLPRSPGITITYTKRIDDPEVEILKEFSPSPEKGAVVGTSASTSKSFQGSCPLCQVNFHDQNVLEIHASTCDGPTHTQVKRKLTFFVFKSPYSSCYLVLHSQKGRTWLSSSARPILASELTNGRSIVKLFYAGVNKNYLVC